jgi:hypothetical protein
MALLPSQLGRAVPCNGDSRPTVRDWVLGYVEIFVVPPSLRTSPRM